jgi:predicted dehydrogenase
METSEQLGIKLSIAHYRREHPYFTQIKNLVESDVIGKVMLVNLHVFQPPGSAIIGHTEDQWRLDPNMSGGGYFYDLAPHQLDLMIHFFGTSHKASGVSGNLSHMYKVDDATSGSILFDNEVLFNGIWWFSCSPGHAKDCCEIIGTKGRLSFSFFDWKPIVVEVGDKKEKITTDALPHVQLPMIEKVVSYFQDEGPNPCTAKDGVEVMKLMEIFTRKV